MRTNVVIDDAILDEAMKLLNLHTKKAVIEEALKRLVRQERRKEIRKLKGAVLWDEEYDYKTMRR